jgi:hypothetical protein
MFITILIGLSLHLQTLDLQDLLAPQERKVKLQQLLALAAQLDRLVQLVHKETLVPQERKVYMLQDLLEQ